MNQTNFTQAQKKTHYYATFWPKIKIISDLNPGEHKDQSKSNFEKKIGY